MVLMKLFTEQEQRCKYRERTCGPEGQGLSGEGKERGVGVARVRESKWGPRGVTGNRWEEGSRGRGESIQTADSVHSTNTRREATMSQLKKKKVLLGLELRHDLNEC